jgi:alkylation response protein AidB-like acyl-CoA dehydrogenase
MNDIRAFVDSEIVPRADGFDAEGKLPRTLIDSVAARGWLGASIAAAFGGGGWDAVAIGRLHGEMGRGCASVRSLLTVQTMVATTLQRWASEAVQAEILPALASGAKLAAFALSEAEAGSDPKALTTRACRTDGGFVLDGEKRWVSFGQAADVFLVFAKLDGAMAAFLVDGDAPGLDRRPVTGLLGMRAAQLASIGLRGCQVPLSRRVGGGDLPLSPVAVTALDVGRYSVAWGCVGLGEACLEASVDYAKSRHQFGKRLLDHQLVARHVAQMVAGTRAARLLCEQAGERRAARAEDAVWITQIAKYFATSTAFAAANAAVQIHGAVGCMAGSAVERHFRDARIMEIIEGSTEIHELMIARAPELESLGRKGR